MSKEAERLKVETSDGILVCTINLEMAGYGQEFTSLTLGSKSKLLAKNEESKNWEEHYLIEVDYKAVVLTIFQSASDGSLYFDGYEVAELKTGSGDYFAVLNLIKAV